MARAGTNHSSGLSFGARWWRSWINSLPTVALLSLLGFPSRAGSSNTSPGSAGHPLPKLPQEIRAQDSIDAHLRDPLEKVRHLDAEIRSIANRTFPDWSPEAAAREMRLDRLLGDLLDYDAIAQRALDSTWVTLGPTERKTFVTTLARLTGRTFLEKTARQRGRITFKNELIAGRRASVLGIACRAGSDPPLTEEVEYRLAVKDGRWLVTDVIIDGVSLVDSYQRQFSTLMKHAGFDGLLSSMQRRLAVHH